MDALPPSNPRALPQPHVSRETFDAYVETANSFAVDALTQSQRQVKWWRAGFLASVVATTALAFSVSGLVSRHTEHWGIMLADPATGTLRVIKDMHDTSVELPVSVDAWFMERYVAMREGWNEADADAAFAAVACMSDTDERQRYATWNNFDKSAPQQLFTKARRGWRAVRIKAPPSVEGVSRINIDKRRVSVPFEWEDKSLGESSKPVTGTAWFTVHKDRSYRQPCNPTGLVVSEYSRQIDRGTP